ncbi:MAG: WbqC family protein [Spirosomataceae bacterium]
MMTPSPLVIELHYLPSLEYFTRLLAHPHVSIEVHEYYQKQSYRNRCYIQTANKVDLLSIPVQEGNRKIPIRDVRIDYQQDWVRRHWGAIYSAYGKASYFEYFSYLFEPVYFKKPVFLFDFNWELLTICLKLLGVDSNKIRLTEKYETADNLTFTDLRSVITPKKQYSERLFYHPVAYRQNFGNEFEPNLSILDLLFCQGKQARTILTQSVIVPSSITQD